MTSPKALLLPLLLGLFTTLVLLEGCISTEEEATYLNVKVNSTWTRYDLVEVNLADSSGRVHTLFHEKLQSPGQLRRLDGSVYDGGSIRVHLIGFFGAEIARRETRFFDGRTGLSGKKKVELAILLPADPAPDGEYLHLTDYPWDYDTSHISCTKYIGSEGYPLVIDGIGYDRGLGCHSSSKDEAYVTYDLKRMGRPIDIFYAQVGINNRGTTPDCGSTVFKVYLDDFRAYTSPVLTTDSLPLPIKVPVGIATTLKLAFTSTGDGNCGAWGNPRLYLARSPNAL